MVDSEWDYGAPGISIVGDNFCVPYTMEMIVKKKIHGFSNAQYDVFDVSGNLLLQVDGKVWKVQKKRVMRDPAGIPILTMRHQAFKWKEPWTIYRGENSEDNVLFTVEETPLSLRPEFNVFLGKNSSPRKSEFLVSGSFASLSCKVYGGKSIIAEVKHSYSWERFYNGKNSFKVTVQPEVDYSFIMALIVILDENEI